MNALLRNVLPRSKDSFLKESLQKELMERIKDIQLDHAHSGQFQSSEKAADDFCTVLEAIFIHGIKERWPEKVNIALGNPDIRPEPNFWPALLIFSHRDIIDKIGRLKFVLTDVGRCRAWLRMALNESLLSSYLQSMLAQNRDLNPFYKQSAYLRDKDSLDMFITLVSSIEEYPFKLTCTSLLDTWTDQPLIMSGVWSPAMKPYSITSGTDIAPRLPGETLIPVDLDSLCSVPSVSSYESPSHLSNFDEDEAFNQIIWPDAANHDHKIFEESDSYSKANSESAAHEPDDTVQVDPCIESPRESKDEADILSTENDKIEDVLEPRIKTENIREVRKLQSFHSLVVSYKNDINETSTTTCSEPDLEGLLEKFPMPSKPSEPFPIESDSEEVEELGFEVLPNSFDPSDMPEFGVLVQYISSIPTEQGLDSQNYICKTCPQNVGVNFREAKVCGLSGAYYCSECFGLDPNKQCWEIPARIIYNWDFRQYSVSNNAANFLLQTQLYPLFDLSVMNNKIYSAVEDMTRLKDIRVCLKFLGDYLKTCRGDAFKRLQRMLWPRDYLYENLHHYSLSDLVQVPSGTLEATLLKAVDFARNHVVSCGFCMQQGFICEICNDPKVVFPFDLDSTYRCDVCGTVYHAKCLLPGQLCRKCSRIQQRQLQQSLTLQQV